MIRHYRRGRWLVAVLLAAGLTFGLTSCALRPGALAKLVTGLATGFAAAGPRSLVVAVVSLAAAGWLLLLASWLTPWPLLAPGSEALPPEIRLWGLLLRAGAAGFVLKRSTAAELISAVHAVASGGSLLFPEPVRDLALRHRRSARYSGLPLTERETEVLALMAEGLSNAAIADRLVLGTETVRTQVAAVLRKLEARDCTHAVVLAYGFGLVDLGG